jgi:hypothetical protein
MGARAHPDAGTPMRARQVPVELGFVAAAVAVNLLVRWYTLDRTEQAVANAHDVHALERTVGLDWEHAVQDAVMRVGWLSDFLSFFYVWGYFPAVLSAMVWLFVRHADAYRTLRNGLLVSGAIGMLGYAFYPCAPPRMVDEGFLDTVAAGPLAAAARPSGLANEIAAMPSFHVGWLRLASIVVFGATRSRLLRATCVLMPVLMSVAVVATGNHWVLDVPAGAAVIALGLLGARLVRSRRTPRRARRMPRMGHVDGTPWGYRHEHAAGRRAGGPGS